MTLKVEKMIKGLPQRYLVKDRGTFDLSSMPTLDHGALKKAEGKAWIRKRRTYLGHLQEQLTANRKYSVLVVLQGMDASGKDSLIRSVMTGMNSQRTKVVSLKNPAIRSGLMTTYGAFTWRYHNAVRSAFSTEVIMKTF